MKMKTTTMEIIKAGKKTRKTIKRQTVKSLLMFAISFKYEFQQTWVMRGIRQNANHMIIWEVCLEKQSKHISIKFGT